MGPSSLSLITGREISTNSCRRLNNSPEEEEERGKIFAFTGNARRRLCERFILRESRSTSGSLEIWSLIM